VALATTKSPKRRLWWLSTISGLDSEAVPVSWRCLLLFILVACALISSKASAAPVTGQIFKLPQPDGTAVEVRIWGDEFYQVVESLDGYVLVRDKGTGVICYASLSEDGTDILSTGIPAGRSCEALDIEPHIRISPEATGRKIRASRSGFAASNILAEDAVVLDVTLPRLSAGNIRGICLIVDFPDEAGTVPPSEVNDFCNQPGYAAYGNSGSIYDYFYDVSDAHLTYTNYVPPEYYTAVHQKAYYDNPGESAGPKARELILEALNHLESSGFDFSQYDSDDDGLIDAVTCLYAGGYSSGWAMGLWPHSASFTAGSFTADGVSASKYLITYLGGSPQIGIFCHETGHILCNWPDLYDTDYDSRGVGRFCLMGYGGQGGTPVEPCAYLKDISGWTNTNLLTVPQPALSVTSAVNSIFKYEHPTLTNEYFLIENRQKIGWDSSLPDSGIAIWHIDTDGWNNSQDMTHSYHYEVTLVQADGLWQLENNVNDGDSNDLWKAPDFTVFGPYYAAPNSTWWDGTAEDFGILDVSASDPCMTFTFGLDPLDLLPDEDFYATGPETGPFSPPGTTYTLTNRSSAAIDYRISKTAPWLSLDDGTGPIDTPIVGTLAPDGTIDIEIILNSNTETLTEGYYTDTIVFSNLTTGIDRARTITLGVFDPVIVVYKTDFNDGLPSDWTIVDGYGDKKTWTSTNPGNRSTAYWTEPFMIVDNWWAGFVNMDEQLITQSINCSNYQSVTLEFSHYFTRITAIADVDISIDHGTWQNVARYTYKSWGNQQIQLPAADRQNSLRIRWRYVAASDYYWGIDDVKITASCAAMYPGDLNRDCSVDLHDLRILVSRWLDGDCTTRNAWCYGADLNRSRIVNFHDLAAFAADWLQGAH
jgi:M6 family metalloprotease-like protein